MAASEWQGQKPLYDPMCGGGTLLCEALMHIGTIPAGYLRPKFGFQFMPDFDAAQWRQVKSTADAQIHPPKAGLIAGSDIDGAAVNAARVNCRTLPGGQEIRLTQADLHTPFQDHPLAFEHFPSGSLHAPPPHLRLSHADLAATTEVPD